MVKKVLYRLPRIVHENETDRKIVLNRLRKYIVDDEEDFQYERGRISKDELKDPGRVKQGKDEFLVLPKKKYDSMNDLERKPQVISDKDAGTLIAKTCIDSDSRVLEAGSGSGFLTLHLGLTGADVDSYEKKKRHYSITKENVEEYELGNVSLMNTGLEDADLGTYSHIILDLPNPERYLDNISETLELGGFLIIYSTNVNQVQEFYSAIEGFIHMETIELIERGWKITEDYARPHSNSVKHTGFLSIYRKSI